LAGPDAEEREGITSFLSFIYLFIYLFLIWVFL
jgi:hypothetical protein